MDEETPVCTPAETILHEDQREFTMHDDHEDVTTLEGGPFNAMQEVSLRNQCARVVAAPATGTAIIPFRTRRCENNSDHPHPPYLQKICSQNMPYNGGPYGIKVG